MPEQPAESPGLQALLWLSKQWEAFRRWLWPCQGTTQLEVVFQGGAMLREGYEMTSPEIALVHRGERVLLLQEVGRRAQVRTGDGFVGWLSFSTAENVPIAQKVRLEGSAGKVRRKEDPSSFREEFESKWRRLRTDVGPPEAHMHSLRQSSGRIPISQWRPGVVPQSPKAPRLVPRIRPPAQTPPKECTFSEVASSPSGVPKVSTCDGSPPVNPAEDLLDLSEPKEDQFNSRPWPDLVQILAASSNPPTYRSEHRPDADGIPDAPPSRRESQLDTKTWLELQKEEEKLLDQLPRFEQLLDEQPDPEDTEVKLTFSTYEMEDALHEGLVQEDSGQEDVQVHPPVVTGPVKVQQEIEENMKALQSQACDKTAPETLLHIDEKT
ncbi:unnamed protein product [Durusdinium trenchii]